MPAFCDIALPVPLDTTFTYRVPGGNGLLGNGAQPVIGGRVLVPFREQRLSGVVVSLHDCEPSVKTKPVLQVLDTAPVLDERLMRLARWIAEYYLAPLGEVFRTMLPLAAEFRRARAYRITDAGQLALHQAGMSGSSARSRKGPLEQMLEFRVLDYLTNRESAREPMLKSATHADNKILAALVRKKWITREDLSSAGEARRTVKVVVLKANARSFDLSSPRQLGSDSLRMTRGESTSLRSAENSLRMTGGESASPPSAESSLGITGRDGASSPASENTLGMGKETEELHRPSPQGETAFSPGRQPWVEPQEENPSPVGAAPKPKLNANQQKILDRLTQSGGRMRVHELRELPVPHTTLQTLVKRGLVEIIEEPADFAVSTIKPRPSPFQFQFTPAQQTALDQIRAAVSSAKYSGFLLHGVTGSGKTAVYLTAMHAVLQAGRSAILLVPEIGLTPAVAADLHQIFGDQVAILHSGLTDRERAEQWHRIRRGDARMVVGTRSAVFAPVSDLALIIVDEEQDGSYKQEETPRYHARDVAVMRARMSGAAVVLGSATPSLESYFNAQKGKYGLLELPDRVEQRPLPEVEILDMKQEFRETGHEQVISRRLAAEIGERLARREQVMVLLNRRGYAPVVLCRACGHTAQCANCAIALTHHKREHRLQCHYCGYLQAVPKACEECGSEYVYFVGTGSEKLEELLHGMFPQARIGRLDRDTVHGRHDFERMLNQLSAGELDILVGTQMIAKGHDVHGVTLVGVIGADIALGLPDFRAAERTFQLLTQVAGRAGRGESPGKVVLQTCFPEHYAVQFAGAHDFRGFYDKELRYRSWMHYPPFNAVANVLVRGEKLDDVLKFSGLLGRWFEKTSHLGIRVLGPAAAPITRLKRDYRYHFLLKSASREKLNALLRAMLAYAAEQKIPRSNLIVDVDAVWLM
ncbi:MAG TPA: primosomal protein N' [Terriglobales bacterium]|nr:primosomal protein N' [Terriglobales bacterium]